MDADRFDTLARSLTTTGSRRSALAAALGGALGPLGLGYPDPAAAKKKKKCPPCKKRKHGKCKKTLPEGTACAGGTCHGGSCIAKPLCVPQCAATNACGSDSCGGTCGSCTEDAICSDGSCVTCGGGGPCRVFLSSTLHFGNFGGLASADAICQGLANAAGFPGIYAAWLSDSTDSPSTRFMHSTGRYKLVNGTTIAANWTDLTDGALAVPINLTETGGGVGATPYAWTNTKSDGTPRDGSDVHCQNWSSTVAAGGGDIGTASAKTSDWTAFFNQVACNNLLHLYCFQQS